MTGSGATWTLVCHTDGASRGNPGPAGAGVAVYDTTGRERRGLAVFLGHTTNNTAEYLALEEALKAAADVCREDGVDAARAAVVIKTDSQLVARQISGEYRVRSQDLLPLYRAFWARARTFRRVEVVYVPREENRRADELANLAIDQGNRSVDQGDRSPATGSPQPTPPEPAGREPAQPERARPRPTPYSRLSHLECSRCGERSAAEEPAGNCPVCGGPLLARYDLKGLIWPPGPSRGGRPAAAREPGPARRRPEEGSMWRYHELLPVAAPHYVVSLGEGLTPLVPLAGLERQLGLEQVLVKDDRLNPTGTFKARGASAAVSRLVELGADKLAIPTAGNAGAAFAAYCARAGLRLLVAMPEDTPGSIRVECEGYGAEVRTVPGLLPDAARYVRERAATEGWHVVSTFDEPYRVEGKKTIAFELFEAFGSRWPDAVVFPVGGGVALVAAWKAALELSWAGLGGRPPKLFAVQAAGCAPVVRAFALGRDEADPYPEPRTVAWGLRVPAPKAGFLILRALRETGGGAVTVPDEEILAAADRLRRKEGLNFSPEGAAAVAALPEIARRGWLDGCREVVLVNTGSGLKYKAAR